MGSMGGFCDESGTNSSENLANGVA